MKENNREITKIARVCQLYVQQVCKEDELGAGEVAFIHYVRHHEGTPLKDIANALHVDKAAITRRARNMEKKGYIEIQESEEDKRKKCIYSLPKANTVKDKTTKAEEKYYAWLLGELSEKERNGFIKTLQTLYDKSKESRKNHFMEV